MSSTSSNSVSHQDAPMVRVVEGVVQQIYHEISQQQVIAILKTALLFLAVYGLKEGLASMFVHRCPQQGHFFYGNLYIFGPIVFFLCFALVFCRPFWEFVTGCCGSRSRKRLLSSPSAAVDIYLAFSAPFLWVAATLSEDAYYLCAVYGVDGETIKRFRCGYGLYGPTFSNEWFEGEAESHVIAWGILISWAITSAFVVSLYRCCVIEGGDTKNI